MKTTCCPSCFVDNLDSSSRCIMCGALLLEMSEEELAVCLVTALDNPDQALVRRAVWILGEQGDARTVDPLIGLIQRSCDPDTIHEAIVALGKIGDPRATTMLLELLYDSHGSFRERAAWALGEIGDPSAASALFSVMDEPDPAINHAAYNALAKIAGIKDVEVTRETADRYQLQRSIGTLRHVPD